MRSSSLAPLTLPLLALLRGGNVKASAKLPNPLLLKHGATPVNVRSSSTHSWKKSYWDSSSSWESASFVAAAIAFATMAGPLDARSAGNPKQELQTVNHHIENIAKRIRDVQRERKSLEDRAVILVSRTHLSAEEKAFLEAHTNKRKAVGTLVTASDATLAQYEPGIRRLCAEVKAERIRVEAIATRVRDASRKDEEELERIANQCETLDKRKKGLEESLAGLLKQANELEAKANLRSKMFATPGVDEAFRMIIADVLVILGFTLPAAAFASISGALFLAAVLAAALDADVIGESNSVVDRFVRYLKPFVVRAASDKIAGIEGKLESGTAKNRMGALIEALKIMDQ